jgi:phage-related protein
MRRFEINFYELPNGLRPVEEFLDSLEVKMRVKAIHSLEILEEHGNMLREPHSKPIQNGICELRIQCHEIQRRLREEISK